jgi:phage terminase large subunit-like protein
MQHSLAQRFAALPVHRREQILDMLGEEGADRLMSDWNFWARPSQLAPPGDWRNWVFRGGRATGKSRAGVEWVRRRAIEHPRSWIAVIAKTPRECREVLIEGPSGFLRNVPPNEIPLWEPSKLRLTFSNGSYCTIFSSETPDALRGGSFSAALIDEFAKFDNPREVWNMLQFGLRESSSSGAPPKVVICTTPRPISIMIEIEKMETTVVTIDSSYSNQAHLDPAWFESIIAPYVGTRLGRAELLAELLTDTPGALWRRDTIERCRVRCDPAVEIRMGDALAPSEQAPSCVGVWTG